MNSEEDTTINRIPGSISDWFSSLPPDRPLLAYTAPASDEQDRIKADLQAMLEPADGAHEGGLRVSQSGDGSFRIKPVESREARLEE